MIMNNLLNTYNEIVEKLVTKYDENEYAKQRLSYHISNLEQLIDTETKTHYQRIDRAARLANEQSVFVKVFLSKNRYYYLQDTHIGCFYEYDGLHYRVVKEDDIQHNILTMISKDDTLQDWKYKTKNTILKQIKETSLFTTTPESSTIQGVLKRLSTLVFNNKRENAKHFLTVLGDNIMKKQKDIIYYVSGKSKQFFSVLEQNAYLTIGQANITRNFIKYHESHSYSKCRLLNLDMNDTQYDVNEETSNDIPSILQKQLTLDKVLDLVCVACHYSNRFGNADEFLTKNASDELRNYVLYLKDNTKENVVEEFCKEMLHESDNQNNSQSKSNIVLKWSDMHYLWKVYMSSKNLPNMMYISNVKDILLKKYQYSELTDSFINVTSKHIPRIRLFIEFWTSQIEIDYTDELEVNELYSLLKAKGIIIGEVEIEKLINHFFPDIEIIKNKYITGIQCKSWNKKKDIITSLDTIKKSMCENNTDQLISFEDLYNNYCIQYKSNMIVSKRYFETFITKHLSKYIEYETFISSEWYIE